MIVYFICYPHGPAEKSGYEHHIVSIAEGLEKLNIKFLGNVNYWKRSTETNDYLIRHDPHFDYHQADVIIFSTTHIHYNRTDLIPTDLYTQRRKYKIVLIDASDGKITPGFQSQFRKADIILKAHYNKKYNYPDNFVPWQFGLTERILHYTTPLPYEERKSEILFNYRVDHQIRKIAYESIISKITDSYLLNDLIDQYDEAKFSELDKLYWLQTGRRHYPDYYKRLCSSKLCAAFGGFFEKSFSTQNKFINKVIRKIDNFLNIVPNTKIYQYDSWRFWESLAAGCCTLHVDLDKYGAVLPVMPKNFEHYFGVDFDNKKKMIRLLKQDKLIEEIGNTGSIWVREHYSPQKIAERFLNLL